MKGTSLKLPLAGALSGAFALSMLSLAAADLWEDHNPYSEFGPVQAGTVLKLSVDEPFDILYEYEQDRDDRTTIKMKPDAKVTPFLPAADSDKSSTGKGRIRVRARSRLRFQVAVAVTATAPGETVNFTGRRVLAYEAGRAVQQLEVRGSVHRGDISAKRQVRSNDTANLEVVIRGAPVRGNRELPMKTKPGEPGQPPVPTAEMTEQEKQQLLLEYLNRILGESEDR